MVFGLTLSDGLGWRFDCDMLLDAPEPVAEAPAIWAAARLITVKENQALDADTSDR
jgi:hypothetical protein